MPTRRPEVGTWSSAAAALDRRNVLLGGSERHYRQSPVCRCHAAAKRGQFLPSKQPRTYSRGSLSIQRHSSRALHIVNSVGSENLLEQLDIRVAESTAEYRAAGYLRATCFYTYPPDRSEFAARTHRRMRGDLEWNAIENKVAGTEAGYEQTRVTCMVATLPVNNGTELVAALKDELDPTCLLPADASHPYPRIIVASLDVNQGVKLPAEELGGCLPQLPVMDPTTGRAYLSNICTAPAMRRRGAAAALIAEAISFAKGQGVAHLYVHVAEDNPGAHKLYKKVLCFNQESEETDAFARRLGRPRRYLLHMPL